MGSSSRSAGGYLFKEMDTGRLTITNQIAQFKQLRFSYTQISI